jgi:protein-S-isoprenylcysteine O-methyltransferase Ste14
VIGALVCLGILGVGRGVMLAARGVRIFPLDRERTLREGVADLGFVLCFLLWVYETLVFALALDAHLVPHWGLALVLDATVAKVGGMLTMSAGLAIYGLALHALGSSWRLGIDRDRPGRLVTSGIFSRSRNPVYLGLELLAVGAFLVLGRLVLLGLAGVFLVYFAHLVRREERFLLQHYGDAYRRYAKRVGRWWTWRRFSEVAGRR